MIHIQQVQTVGGQPINLTLESSQQSILDARHLHLFPGLIDPHVHFRTPGLEEKEDWKTAALASLNGGYTQVFDMPNTLPPTVTIEAFREKQNLIDQQLTACNIPLRYQLFLGADKHHLGEIRRAYQHELPIAGIKVFMGCSTGGMLIQDSKDLAEIFRLAAELDFLVAVHAESEAYIEQNRQQFPPPQPYYRHSQIRDSKVAVAAVEQAIALVRQYGTRLYIVHVSTQEELDKIVQAKSEGLPVFAEVAPHHLFLTELDYERLQGRAIMNPPLRSLRDQKALWQALNEGVIDTIGSDHAPHLLQEKQKAYGACPAGVPGIETTLALLLDAYNKGLISLSRVVTLTSKRAREIFRLPDCPDYTLVNLQLQQQVNAQYLSTKCQWSPFEGYNLQGWPVFVILKNQLYELGRSASDCFDIVEWQ